MIAFKPIKVLHEFQYGIPIPMWGYDDAPPGFLGFLLGPRHAVHIWMVTHIARPGETIQVPIDQAERAIEDGLASEVKTVIGECRA